MGTPLGNVGLGSLVYKSGVARMLFVDELVATLS